MTSARPTGWPGCVCPGAGRGCSLGPARDGRRQQAWRPGRPTSPTRSLWRGLMGWRPAGRTLPLAHGADALPERRDLLAPRLPDRRRFPRPQASRDDARHVLNVSHQLAFSLQFRGVQRSAVSTDCAGTAPRSALVLVSGHFSREAVSGSLVATHRQDLMPADTARTMGSRGGMRRFLRRSSFRAAA